MKTFVVAPDRSRIPFEFLKGFCMKGCEVHFLEGESRAEIDLQIRNILAFIPEVFFLCCIDSRIPDLDWTAWIETTEKTWNGRIHFGILYNREHSQSTIQDFFYHFRANGTHGRPFLPLDVCPYRNLFSLANMLESLRVNGSRSVLRARGGTSSSVKILADSKVHAAEVFDISITHLSCYLPDEWSAVSENTVCQIECLLDREPLYFNGKLAHKRNTSDGVLYVFAIMDVTGLKGFFPEAVVKLNSFVYERCSREIWNADLTGSEYQKKARISGDSVRVSVL